MADTKLSALSAAAALDGTELVEVVQGGTNKKVALSLASPLLRATGVKTTAYSAVIWDEVPVDTTGGTLAVTLPTAPLDGSEIVVKWTAGTAAPTVVTGGADVLNVAAGSTTATFSALNQVLTFRYKATGAIYYVETGFSKGGLDTLYKPASVAVTLTSSATPAIAVGTAGADIHVSITALAAAITSMTSGLTGTPVDFQKMLVRIKDDATPRAITWGASYASRGASLPTTTVASKLLTVGLLYNSVTSLWGCVAVALEV